MPEKPSRSKAEETLAAKLPTTIHQTLTRTGTSIRAKQTANLGHWFMGLWAIAGAIATANQTNLSQMLERQAQVLCFELRGPVTPPTNIIILGIDEDSTVQGTQVYPTDPKKYADLASLQTSPPKRSAYATAIDRVMQAGARTVAVDVVMDAIGSDSAADRQLQMVLAKYPKRITLAARFDNTLIEAGQRTQPIMPNPIFEVGSPLIGHINYAIAPNGRLHTLGKEYAALIAESYPPEVAKNFLHTNAQLPSFAEAVLQSAQVPYVNPKGQDIFYYGPKETFPHLSLWQVLDRGSWANHLRNGTFKDKIVLIGPTDVTYRDFHAAPFSGTFRYLDQMTGIEINANAIATLQANRSIAQAIPQPLGQAAYVLVIGLVGGYLQTQHKRLTGRVLLASGMLLVIGAISYSVFTYRYLTLPMAVPLSAIALSSLTYFLTQTASAYLRRLQLRETLAQYANSPIIREILSQQDDLRDILTRREQAVFGKKLAARYRITKVLGSGGFSETYIAEDTHRPGNPACVVKQLRVISDNPKLLQLARMLFQREAATLEKLGKHDRIPQLLAYFEEESEFYLVQEFIPGHPLSTELRMGIPLPEIKVITILHELLEILDFVHSQNVIHRDIKPSNIIRRKSDQKLVLIDFGAVKAMQTLAEETQLTSATIGIGTKGFMPSEQYAGNPRFSSDLYALGITGIQAVTGLPPNHLKIEPRTGELIWRDRALVSRALADVISKMVRYDFSQRYQSASEVLQALEAVYAVSTTTTAPAEIMPLEELPQTTESEVFLQASTQPWPQSFFQPDPDELPQQNSSDQND